MIQAHELRIGNWVSNGDINFTVDVNVLYDFWQFYDYKENIFPITLTPDILTVAGFKNGNKEVAKCDLWNKYWIDDFELDNSGADFDYETTSIKYVHQLQNLYFAIVQKELEISL